MHKNGVAKKRKNIHLLEGNEKHDDCYECPRPIAWGHTVFTVAAIINTRFLSRVMEWNFPFLLK